MRLTLALVFSLALPASAHATTWYVSDEPVGGPVPNGLSWEDALPSVQDAVDAAYPNDVIRIASGSYDGAVVDKPLRFEGYGSFPVYLEKPLVLHSSAQEVTLADIHFRNGGRIRAASVHLEYVGGTMSGNGSDIAIRGNGAELVVAELSISSYDGALYCIDCTGSFEGVTATAVDAGLALDGSSLSVLDNEVHAIGLALETYGGDTSVVGQNLFAGTGGETVRLKSDNLFFSNVIEGGVHVGRWAGDVVHNTVLGDLTCQSNSGALVGNNAVDGDLRGKWGNLCPDLEVTGTLFAGTIDTPYIGLAVLNAERKALRISPTTYRPYYRSPLRGMGQSLRVAGINEDFYGRWRAGRAGDTSGACQK